MPTRFIRVAVGKMIADNYKILVYPKKPAQDAHQKKKEKVVWKFYNYTGDKIWCKVTNFKKKGGTDPNSPFPTSGNNRLKPVPVGVDAPQANGNERQGDISGTIKNTAETVIYTYEVHIGSSAGNLKLVNDPELRVDDDTILNPKKSKTK